MMMTRRRRPEMNSVPPPQVDHPSQVGGSTVGDGDDDEACSSRGTSPPACMSVTSQATATATCDVESSAMMTTTEEECSSVTVVSAPASEGRNEGDERGLISVRTKTSQIIRSTTGRPIEEGRRRKRSRHSQRRRRRREGGMGRSLLVFSLAVAAMIAACHKTIMRRCAVAAQDDVNGGDGAIPLADLEEDRNGTTFPGGNSTIVGLRNETSSSPQDQNVTFSAGDGYSPGGDDNNNLNGTSPGELGDNETGVDSPSEEEDGTDDMTSSQQQDQQQFPFDQQWQQNQQCVVAPVPYLDGTHKRVYHVGVLAIRGFDAAYAEFNRTFSDYLTSAAGSQFSTPVEFRLKPLNFLLLFSDVEENNVDFVYVNPSAYSCIESEYGAHSLVSQISKRRVGGNTYDLTQFGGVIFTRDDSRDIRTIGDIRNKSVAAASISGLGSGQMQFRRLQEAGLSYINDPSQVVFTSNQGKVVNGVLSGKFEVGFVRTDQIERTKDPKSGELIDKSLLRVIEPVANLTVDGVPFPFESSTRLYAEWNLAALPHVPDDVSRAVQGAMLALADHADVGSDLASCLAEQNCTTTGGDDDDDAAANCEESCLEDVYSSTSSQSVRKRCDSDPDLALLAHEAKTAGKYTGWRTTLSYMELRNMQEETGFIRKDPISGKMRCIRSKHIYEAIVCPPGHFKKSEIEVENGCKAAGLDCDDDFQCVCRPCVKAFDVNVFPSVQPGVGGMMEPCEKFSLCGSVEQRKELRFTAVDNKRRDGANVTVRLHEGEDSRVVPTTTTPPPELDHTGNYAVKVASSSGGETPTADDELDNFTHYFTVSARRVGVLVMEVFADGTQIPQSPFRVSVRERDCATEWDDPLRVADAEGECVCSANSVQMGGGRCVSLALLLPAILVPLALIAAAATYAYVERKKKQADSVWAVKVADLHFADPPVIVGRGTFGLVLLAEYRGTQVAVKRVIPPKVTKSSASARYLKGGRGSTLLGRGDTRGSESGLSSGGLISAKRFLPATEDVTSGGEGDGRDDDAPATSSATRVNFSVGTTTTIDSGGTGSSNVSHRVESSVPVVDQNGVRNGDDLPQSSAPADADAENGGVSGNDGAPSSSAGGTGRRRRSWASLWNSGDGDGDGGQVRRDLGGYRRHSDQQLDKKSGGGGGKVPSSSAGTGRRRRSWACLVGTSGDGDEVRREGGGGHRRNSDQLGRNASGQRRLSWLNLGSVGDDAEHVDALRRPQRRSSQSLDSLFESDQPRQQARRRSSASLDDDFAVDGGTSSSRLSAADLAAIEEGRRKLQAAMDTQTMCCPSEADDNRDEGMMSGKFDPRHISGSWTMNVNHGGKMKAGKKTKGMRSGSILARDLGGGNGKGSSSLGNRQSLLGLLSREGSARDSGKMSSGEMSGGASVQTGGWRKPFSFLAGKDEYSRLKAEFIIEMRHLSKLRHPCITTVMGAVISARDEPMLVMEYMDHGSLYDLLHNETLFIDGELVLPILRDIAQGVRFLHTAEPKVIHGDLKAQNVLVDGKFRAKVADFGLSQKKKVGATGTPYWMAPELLRGESENTTASDVYSFGIILYEMYSRKDPYEGEQYREVLKLVADPVVNKRPPVPSACPPLVASLMKECLVGNPTKRPSFEELDQRLRRLDVDTVEPGKMKLSYQSRKELMARRTSDLFQDLFPRHVAQALQEGRKVEPESFDMVTIFFSDIVGFTTISSVLSAEKVCDMLDRLYLSFDELADKHDVFKIETIGDAYLCVSNMVKDQSDDHVKRIAEFSVDAIRAANETLINPEDPTMGYVNIRVGFHSGPVVANVLGTRNPKYSIFGDTVNTASRMESNSKENRIQCSDVSAGLLARQQPNLPLVRRGKIQVKGKGEMCTYWVNQEGRLSSDSTRSLVPGDSVDKPPQSISHVPQLDVLSEEVDSEVPVFGGKAVKSGSHNVETSDSTLPEEVEVGAR